MTRAHHVTNSYTAERQEKIRKLVVALQLRSMSRDEIGALLELGPSGVRKYLADLGALIAQSAEGGGIRIRLSASQVEVLAYLSALAVQASPRRARKSDMSIATLDPSRRFHIMADDEHFAIRLNRSPVARDPMVAALFGAGLMEARA
jgi:hypothetical protein